jgi:DNA-binding MarR family transcriptional regulator
MAQGKSGQGSRKDDAVELGTIEAGRRRNMRQLLLRASRIVNRHIVEGLHARGYADLRSTHTTLLSNIDLAGSTVTTAADRAGITKQAMGRLATELEGAGYIRVRADPNDARARVLQLSSTASRSWLNWSSATPARSARIGSSPSSAALQISWKGQSRIESGLGWAKARSAVPTDQRHRLRRWARFYRCSLRHWTRCRFAHPTSWNASPKMRGPRCMRASRGPFLSSYEECLVHASFDIETAIALGLCACGLATTFKFSAAQSSASSCTSPWLAP